jgi:arylsulfatase A-like enzyme
LNVLLVSIDSLARHWLEPYGRRVEIPVDVPSMSRLAEAAQFDRHWVGSLPCMPARREFLAGVIEFPWRPWGPMEPFDVPLARTARGNGVRTALVTDHFHYWEHAAGGYHEDYDSWDFVRGHEYDAWKLSPRQPDPILLRQILAPDDEPHDFPNRWHYARNVHGLEREEDFFAARVFTGAAAAARALAGRDEPWFLYVDSFDVHEPFHCPEPYASMFTDDDPRDPELVLWPEYGPASSLGERQLAFVRAQFAGKLAMVDRWLGMLLDTLDELGLWDRTTVIVTSDHGHFLGEHGHLGKPFVPVYDTLARTPLWIHHPGAPRNRKIEALTTAVDVYATVLDALGIEGTGGPHSRSLLPLVRGDTDTHRDAVLYGWFGGAVNVTDGQHTYFHPGRPQTEVSCHSSRLLATFPTDAWFRAPPLPGDVESGRFLPYTDTQVWRYPGGAWPQAERPELYDVAADPDQLDDLAGRGDPNEERLRSLLERELRALDAPPAQFERLELA